MKYFDIVILGSGASGCFCALNYTGEGTIGMIDSNDYPAKKLLVTGNGRCNLTNLDCGKEFYNQDISSYFEFFNSKNTIDSFKSYGLQTYTDEEGRVYPVSNSSKSVVEIINLQLGKRNIETFCNQTIQTIKYKNGNFEVQTDKDFYMSKKLVVATGVLPLPLLKEFNLKISRPVPSLVSLKTQEKNRRIDGIKVSNVEVTCKVGDVTKSEIGEIMVKENALSGICIFNLSSYFARQKDFEGKIFVNFLPQYSFEQLVKILKDNCKIFDYVENLLTGLLHKEIANDILYRSQIDLKMQAKKLKEEDIILLANLISNLEYNISDCLSNNQVYSGGIKLDCLTQDLMSKDFKDMYFCGEICDVDGICGGYNLQWAWTSGYIVSQNL